MLTVPEAGAVMKKFLLGFTLRSLPVAVSTPRSQRENDRCRHYSSTVARFAINAARPDDIRMRSHLFYRADVDGEA